MEFYNNNIPWGELTNKKVNEIFWNQVYSKVKSISHLSLSKEPKKITMLMISPEGTYVHFTNLTKRKLNAKKIKDILAYDWGFKISFNLPLDGNNNVITNPIDILNNSGIKVEPGNLADFETVRLNISGVTRVNETWKGSNMIYGAN